MNQRNEQISFQIYNTQSKVYAVNGDVDKQKQITHDLYME